jgi:RNA polymerase sigma-70 factor, ECF subfamily
MESRASAPAGRADQALSSRYDDGDEPPSSGGRARPHPLLVAYVSRPSTWQKLRGWLLRLAVQRGQVDDLAQDVLEEAIENGHTYRPEIARPERWLNRIAVHVAAHWHDQARHRREDLTSAPPARPSALPSAELLFGAEEDRLALLDALMQLPAPLAAVVKAHDLDGEPMSTIAERHGIPVSTAYKWRTRGLAALAILMRQQGK